MISQKVEKTCHFERQREIFILNHLVLNVINPTRDKSRNPRLRAEKVGWISGSASTEARDIGGCAIAYPPCHFA
jgi:hypothetical protein